MSLPRHKISLDEQKFQSKPEGAVVGTIVNRIASPDTDIEVNIKELIEQIVQPNGQTWCPAIFTNSSKTIECWQSQGFIALDFDCEDENHADPKEAEKYRKEVAEKRKYFGGNYTPMPKYEHILERCEKYGVMPCAIHNSFSSDDTNNRFRVIFQLDHTNTNPDIAKFIIYAFYMLFPESDKQLAVDTSRFFFGGRDLLWSDYENTLDIRALFEGAVKYIDETYPGNSERIKNDFNRITGVNSIQSITVRDLYNMDETEKRDVIEYVTKDNKIDVIKFNFGERLMDEDITELKQQSPKTVMSAWDIKWVSDALNYVDSYDRKIWIDIGMGLKQSFGESSKDLWKEWSKKASNADDDNELEKRWNGLKPNGSITVGTLRELAKQNGYDPTPETIKEYNKKYFHYINDRGSEVVVEEVINEVKNRFGKVVKDIHLKHINRTAFINFNEGVDPIIITKNNKEIVINRGKYWITNSMRRRVRKIVFNPKGDVRPDEYNLWSNFDSMKEYVRPEDVDPSKFNLYMKHLYEIIANGNTEVGNYILAWMAYAVQNPDKIPEVVIVMIGPQGAGKSLFVDLFGQIFGKHYICIQSEDALTGRFNSHLANKVLVFADEAVWRGDHKAIQKLKNNTTNPKFNLEGKGKDIEDYDNYMHIMMASNNRTVLKIDPDDRRFFIVDLNDKWYKRKDESEERKQARKDYFNDMVHQFNHEGGMEHFFSFLKNFDLSGFNIRDYPNTDIKDEHKLAGIETELEGFLYSKLQLEILYEDQLEWGCVKRTDFYEEYCAYIRRHNPRFSKPFSNVKFGQELQRIFPGCVKSSTGNVRVKYDDGFKIIKENVYRFESLDKCRAVFCDAINVDVKWDDPIENNEGLVLDMGTDSGRDFAAGGGKKSENISENAFDIVVEAVSPENMEGQSETDNGTRKLEDFMDLFCTSWDDYDGEFDHGKLN